MPTPPARSREPFVELQVRRPEPPVTPTLPGRLWTIPHLLSLSRIPLAAVLFVCITYEWWPAGLAVFAAAALTDWLDGWWARRFGPPTALGRSLDPLTDKVLVCGTFIYLMADPRTGVLPWMVTVVVCREVIVTGVRGIVEAAGRAFGADRFGKLKTALQCAAIIGVLLVQWLRQLQFDTGVLRPLEVTRDVLLYATVLATAGSGLQYLVRAVKLLR
jgi:CDP-diacylglycerol--glycerol-3-phosphate 3-phosphatidyltransferase